LGRGNEDEQLRRRVEKKVKKGTGVEEWMAEEGNTYVRESVERREWDDD